MKRGKRIILLGVIILTMCVSGSGENHSFQDVPFGWIGGEIVYAEETEQNNVRMEEVGELYALSAVLMDADSGRILASKDGDTMRPMASTTKIMTCILALEEGNLDDVVTASAEAAEQPAVHIGMQEGEQFVLRDLLYSLMLESHNDTAVAIAEHLAGSVPAFAEQMNQKAEELGCQRAHFVTPNGLDGEDEGGVHSISAEDLAKIMSYCVAKSPKAGEFLEITQTESYSFSNIEGSRSVSCGNHNVFLSMMEGAISGKTGFTGDAGYCYVGALRSEERTFAVALLACGWPNNKNYKWADTEKLMNYGLEHFTYQDVWEEPVLKKLPVSDGIPESNSLYEKAQVQTKVEADPKSLRVLLGDMEQVTTEVNQPANLQAPVKAGDPAGSIRYLLCGEVIGEYPIVAGKNVEKKDWDWYASRILSYYLMG